MPNLYPHQQAFIEALEKTDLSKQHMVFHARREGKSWGQQVVSYAQSMRLMLEGQRVLYLCESARMCKHRFDEVAMMVPPSLFIPNARQGSVYVAGDQGAMTFVSVDDPHSVYRARGNCGQIIFDPSMRPHTWSDQLWGRYREWCALAEHFKDRYPQKNT